MSKAALTQIICLSLRAKSRTSARGERNAKYLSVYLSIFHRHEQRLLQRGVCRAGVGAEAAVEERRALIVRLRADA